MWHIDAQIYRRERRGEGEGEEGDRGWQPLSPWLAGGHRWPGGEREKSEKGRGGREKGGREGRGGRGRWWPAATVAVDGWPGGEREKREKGSLEGRGVVLKLRRRLYDGNSGRRSPSLSSAFPFLSLLPLTFSLFSLSLSLSSPSPFLSLLPPLTATLLSLPPLPFSLFSLSFLGHPSTATVAVGHHLHLPPLPSQPSFSLPSLPLSLFSLSPPGQPWRQWLPATIALFPFSPSPLLPFSVFPLSLSLSSPSPFFLFCKFVHQYATSPST